MTSGAVAVREPGVDWDLLLLGVTAALVLLGVLGVYSASISYAAERTGWSAYYLVRQGSYLVVAVALAGALAFVPLEQMRRLAGAGMVFGLAALVLVLVPGIGREVNGAMRWVSLGPLALQPSEFIKPLFVLYTAGLLSRETQVEQGNRARLLLVGPVTTLVLICGLLLLEPDFGAAVVLVATATGVLLVAGLSWRHFAYLIVGCGCMLALLAVTSPYRMARLTAFVDPWADPFGDGFQLTQALMAFGRGGWFGVGLGESVQKLFYLPEAHTDFLLAILAEELGLVGVLVVLMLFSVLVLRIFSIGHAALRDGARFSALLAYGIGLLIGIQAFVNMGVNMGLLPTKGLTLPLMSYGGSSLIANAVAIGLVLRVDHERRLGGAP